MPGPGGHGGGPGGHGGPHGPMGGRGRGPGGPHGPMGGPHGPMGGPPPHHHRWGGYWGYRRPYRGGCLGGFLALLLGCGGMFAFLIFAISTIF